MIGQKTMMAILKSALVQAKDQATIVCFARNFGLTRFANNYIHQNVHIDEVKVVVRAQVGGRVGISSTTGFSQVLILGALKRAEQLAKSAPTIPAVPDLPGPQTYADVDTFVEATAGYSPMDRAQAVRTICEISKADNGIASGFLSTGYSELAVVNSAGIEAYTPLSAAELMTIIGDGPASGYGSAVMRDVTQIDFEQTAKTAMEKCAAGRKRVDIEPGDFEVVLEPAAVAGAFEWLGYVGLGAKSVDEGTSFLAGRQGTQLVGQNISVADDGSETAAMGTPFDFDGVAKRRVDFFDHGIVGGPVTDTRFEAYSNGSSTGHAPPPDDAGMGPIAMNVVMAPGESDLPTMIGHVKHGILVTRFHYINGYIDTREGVLTGMTRDGTFLIENGEVVAGLPNLRFMQSFMEALRNVREISAHRAAKAAWWADTGAYLMPALRIDGFRFIGVQKEN